MEDIVTLTALEILAFFFIFMAIASAMFFVCSLRTNIVFVFIFALLTITFALLASAYWVLAKGQAALSGRIEKVYLTLFLVQYYSSFYFYFYFFPAHFATC